MENLYKRLMSINSRSLNQQVTICLTCWLDIPIYHSFLQYLHYFLCFAKIVYISLVQVPLKQETSIEDGKQLIYFMGCIDTKSPLYRLDCRLDRFHSLNVLQMQITSILNIWTLIVICIIAFVKLISVHYLGKVYCFWRSKAIFLNV